jgi:hypothetical protein
MDVKADIRTPYSNQKWYEEYNNKKLIVTYNVGKTCKLSCSLINKETQSKYFINFFNIRDQNPIG